MLSPQLSKGLSRLCRLSHARLAPLGIVTKPTGPSSQFGIAVLPSSLHRYAQTLHGRPLSQLRAAEAASEPTTEQGSIYDNPQMYDDAFSYRDFASECSFLQQLYQHHTGEAVKSILELG
jgi:hypothetical protein